MVRCLLVANNCWTLKVQWWVKKDWLGAKTVPEDSNGNMFSHVRDEHRAAVTLTFDL